jgi:glucokinase
MQTPDSPLTAIAVDLGATRMRAGLVRRDGTISQFTSITTPPNPGNTDTLVSLIGDLIEGLIRHSDAATLSGVGISAAGPVNCTSGEVVHPPNIPLTTIPLVRPLEDRFSLPVYLMNDCHTGALGEAWYGDGKNIPHFVYLTISTGIGAGVFEQGRLLFGSDGNFAEVGHVTVETTWDLPCGCGGSGHWEGCGSGRFMPAFFQAWCQSSGATSPFETVPDASELFAASNKGDPIVSGFLVSLGMVQARGISALIAAYDPSLIIIDGSVARNNWHYFQSSVFPRVRSVSGKMPRIILSRLGGNAPLLGAAACVFGGMPGHTVNRRDQ